MSKLTTAFAANKYVNRLNSSERGEKFNRLSFPFLLATFAYGIGFTFFLPFNDWLGKSSVFAAMQKLGHPVPIIWGILALVTITLGFTFLMFNIPPIGKFSGLMGFSLWLFVAMAYAIQGDWMVLFGVAAPNMWFWAWQYASLSNFRREDAIDKATMEDYDGGKYDDELNPIDGKHDREENRGRDRQTNRSYDTPDDGVDTSRFI